MSEFDKKEPKSLQGLDIAQRLIPAIEEQMSSKETLYVREHYDRLLADGIPEHEVKEMLALCLADEIERMNNENDRQFNQMRYQMMLGFLPKLPDA